MELTVLNTIHPGDKIDLHYVNSVNEDVFLKTVIYDVLSEDEILIHNPLYEGKLFMIPMNVSVSVLSKKPNVGVIAFRMQLHKRLKKGQVYTISCEIISEIKKQQRRNFFRVKLYKDINIIYMSDKNDKMMDYYIFDSDAVKVNEIETAVEILDISGGGFKFKSKIPFDLGIYIYTKLKFLGLNKEVYGVVVRSVSSVTYDGEYEIGISFENLPPDIGRKISSYVLSSQQKLVRRERH